MSKPDRIHSFKMLPKGYSSLWQFIMPRLRSSAIIGPIVFVVKGVPGGRKHGQSIVITRFGTGFRVGFLDRQVKKD